ncbi:hypothetical protein [Streptomyces sp. HPF1205]|uniref:hypothetical protein n=1 Tax=Streptomyces sp. HPF1205 TaxID=2873262 RepID=UPI001CED77AA|nr:hypothetical protein [Streptomyces sp. HPF1205]
MEISNKERAATAVVVYPICGERTYLPAELMGRALELAAGGTVGSVDVERQLRCTLQAHTIGDHFAFVVELDGGHAGSVWARWTRGHSPAGVVVLPDCEATSGSTAEPCCEFAGHPGGHTFELADPWASSVVASL